jgi:beta-glucosidase
MVEDGAVLLKNDKATLPLSSVKYSKIAVFGVGATAQNQVSENHGGFVKDSTMIVQAPLAALERRGTAEGIEVRYAEAYPGNGIFSTIPPSMFLNGGLNVSYYSNLDFSGTPAVTDFVPNITAATYPPQLWEAYPDAFTAVYEGVFLPNTTGTYHFSLVGTGTSLLYLDDVLVGNQSFHNFGGDYVQGIAFLTEGSQVRLRLEYSTAYSLATGSYGVNTLKRRLWLNGRTSTSCSPATGYLRAAIAGVGFRCRETRMLSLSVWLPIPLGRQLLC